MRYWWFVRNISEIQFMCICIECPCWPKKRLKVCKMKVLGFSYLCRIFTCQALTWRASGMTWDAPSSFYHILFDLSISIMIVDKQMIQALSAPCKCPAWVPMRPVLFSTTSIPLAPPVQRNFGAISGKPVVSVDKVNDGKTSWTLEGYVQVSCESSF